MTILLRAVRRVQGSAALMMLGCIALLGGCSGVASDSLNAPAVQLASIAVGPPDSRVAMGYTNQFTATGIYTDGSKRDLSGEVTWMSSDAAIAVINASGVARMLSPGTTTIQAHLGRLQGSTSLAVTPATLVSIGVTPANAQLAAGLSSQLKAWGVYSDNSTHDLTGSVSWSSSATAVAAVGSAAGSMGVLSALAPGAATITAALDGVSGSTMITVTNATLVALDVTPVNSSIASGLSQPLVATGVYTDHSTQNLTAAVAWSSSNPSVAAVSNAPGTHGIVTAAMPGSATIAASLGGIAASTPLTVTPATLVSIGVTPANASLAKGLQTQFTATGTYTDQTMHDLTGTVVWSSSDPTIAAVSNALGYDGLVSALGPGSITITATLGGVSGSTPLTVTPATLVSIAVVPAHPSIAAGTSQQFTASGTYTDHSSQDLTAAVAWSSSDTTIAAVSNAAGSNGLATSLTTGAVTITAALGPVSGSAGLTVTPAVLASITVLPGTASIADGTSLAFTAVGTYTDGSTQGLTSAVSWTSSSTSIASVSNAAGSNGLASATGQGSTTITAALGPIAGSGALTVTPAALVSIAVTPLNASIMQRTTQQFTATGHYTDGSTQPLTAQVTWSSTDPGTASVSNATGSNGLATGADVGTTQIGATLGAVASPTVALTVTAAPEYAYAANQNDGTLSEYLVNVDGSLSVIGTIAAGNEPNAVVVDPGVRYVYAANWSDGTISQYAIGSGGALSSLATIAAGTNPSSLAIDPSGEFVYSANLGDNDVSEFAIGADGTLSSIGTIAAGNGAIGLNADPVAPYLYVACQGSNAVSEYSIQNDGTLASLGTVATGNDPQAVAIDPLGRYAYVANWTDDSVSEYSIGPGGTLTQIGTIASGSNPESLAVDPTGHYLYVANYSDSTISEYAIGSGGVLSSLGTIPAGSGPWFINVDPSGRYVYAVTFDSSLVNEYTVGAGGVLSPNGTAPTGSGPNAIATD